MNTQTNRNAITSAVTKWLSTPQNRRKLLLVVLLFPVFLGLTSVEKYVHYAYFTNANELRQSVGKQVLYVQPRPFGTEEYRGTLLECFYKVEDKWGFFSLRVHIQGDSVLKDNDGNIIREGNASISTLLEPQELSRITILP